jgi:hypothetical protein
MNIKAFLIKATTSMLFATAIHANQLRGASPFEETHTIRGSDVISLQHAAENVMPALLKIDLSPDQFKKNAVAYVTFQEIYPTHPVTIALLDAANILFEHTYLTRTSKPNFPSLLSGSRSSESLVYSLRSTGHIWDFQLPPVCFPLRHLAN